MKCELCGEPVEVEDQPEGAALCNSCAAYLNAKFAPLVELLTDPALYENLPENDT